jgi:hypothetical protein
MVPPMVICPLPVRVVVAAGDAKDGPEVLMLAPAGTVMLQPVTVTWPDVKSPLAVTGPVTVTSSAAEASKSPPPKPPCTRTSATVMSRSAV